MRECWRAGLLPVPVGVTDTLRPDSRLDDHGLLLFLFCHLPLIHSCEVDVDVGAPMDTWPPEVVGRPMVFSLTSLDDPRRFLSFLWTTHGVLPHSSGRPMAFFPHSSRRPMMFSLNSRDDPRCFSLIPLDDSRCFHSFPWTTTRSCARMLACENVGVQVCFLFLLV